MNEKTPFLGEGPRLFDYLDPAAFVRDRRTFLGLSYQALADATGKSTSKLHRICHGESQVTLDMVPGLSEVFGLSANEAAYLEKLIEFQSADAQSRKRRLVGLMETRLAREELENAGKSVESEVARLRQLLSWEATALLTLAQFAPVADDEQQIARMFVGKVEPRRIRATIDSMVRGGLLERRDGMLFSAAPGTIHVDAAPHLREAMRMYHLAVLERAAEALIQLGSDERLYMTQTVQMDREQFDAFRSMVAEREVSELFQAARKRASASGGEGRIVVQLGVFLFPVLSSVVGEASRKSVEEEAGS